MNWVETALLAGYLRILGGEFLFGFVLGVPFFLYHLQLTETAAFGEECLLFLFVAYWLLIEGITDFRLGWLGGGQWVFLFGESACVSADEVLQIFLYIDGTAALRHLPLITVHPCFRVLSREAFAFRVFLLLFGCICQ
jgi:hypothetical protein